MKSVRWSRCSDCTHRRHLHRYCFSRIPDVQRFSRAASWYLLVMMLWVSSVSEALGLGFRVQGLGFRV
eukprot:289644-Chlamydomonas_euryale.AAC.1